MQNSLDFLVTIWRIYFQFAKGTLAIPSVYSCSKLQETALNLFCAQYILQLYLKVLKYEKGNNTTLAVILVLLHYINIELHYRNSNEKESKIGIGTRRFNFLEGSKLNIAFSVISGPRNKKGIFKGGKEIDIH